MQRLMPWRYDVAYLSYDIYLPLFLLVRRVNNSTYVVYFHFVSGGLGGDIS